MENTRPFIFYLTLEEKLPDQFYVFDSLFKEMDYILVPVTVDQLPKLVASTEQDHVMVINCVSSFREYKLFNTKVRSILKYVLKSRRISFIEISSFSKLNDSRVHSLSKNYFFLKTPVDGRALVKRMISFHSKRSEQSNLWPGGARSMAAGVA